MKVVEGTCSILCSHHSWQNRISPTRAWCSMGTSQHRAVAVMRVGVARVAVQVVVAVTRAAVVTVALRAAGVMGAETRAVALVVEVMVEG